MKYKWLYPINYDINDAFNCFAYACPQYLHHLSIILIFRQTWTNIPECSPSPTSSPKGKERRGKIGFSWNWQLYRLPDCFRSLSAGVTEDYSCQFGSVQYHTLCGLAGALACGLTHTVLTPVDLLKCRIQVREDTAGLMTCWESVGRWTRRNTRPSDTGWRWRW